MTTATTTQRRYQIVWSLNKTGRAMNDRLGVRVYSPYHIGYTDGLDVALWQATPYEGSYWDVRIWDTITQEYLFP